MPIEFHCTGCGKLLRTADESAGRAARCPACGAVTDVPERPMAPQEYTTPVRAEASPFSPTEPIEDFDAPVNPYQAPGDTSAGSPFASAMPPIERVRGPAISLIVMGSLGLVMHLGITVLYGALFVVMLNDPEFQRQPEDAFVGFGIMIGAGVLGMIMAILAIVGGVKMKNLRSYALAMTGAIIMLIPCFSACGIFGVPFGIWALIVLANSEVRDAFR